MIRYGILATIALLLAAAVVATLRDEGATDRSNAGIASNLGQGDLQQRLSALNVESFRVLIG